MPATRACLPLMRGVRRHVTVSEILQSLRQLEIELHQSETRANISRLAELLHPDFEEFGRSGKVYSRSDILAESWGDQELPDIQSGEFKATEIGEGIVLLTYVSAHRGESGELKRRALRSSLWVLGDVGWQMRFHQGTPLNA